MTWPNISEHNAIADLQVGAQKISKRLHFSLKNRKHSLRFYYWLIRLTRNSDSGSGKLILKLTSLLALIINNTFKFIVPWLWFCFHLTFVRFPIHCTWASPRHRNNKRINGQKLSWTVGQLIVKTRRHTSHTKSQFQERCIALLRFHSVCTTLCVCFT